MQTVIELTELRDRLQRQIAQRERDNWADRKLILRLEEDLTESHFRRQEDAEDAEADEKMIIRLADYRTEGGDLDPLAPGRRAA